MILPDMTSEQMLKVMDSDRDAIHQFADRFMACDGKRILRSKQTRFPCSLTKFFTADSSKQRYLLTFRIATKSEAYEDGHRFYFRAIINTWYGTEAANILYDRKNDTRFVVYLRSHLFQRYAERMGLTMPKDELIRYFTKRNPVMIEATEWRKKNDCMMMCHDGACFGEVSESDPQRIDLKTFIATDTMQDGTYRARLNGVFDKALCGALWEQYLQDPEHASFLAQTTKRRKDE